MVFIEQKWRNNIYLQTKSFFSNNEFAKMHVGKK